MTPSVVDDAIALLGATLTHGAVSVRISEVEAYEGREDPASHAYRGRTPRNDVMFGPPNRLYVYFSYGMHWCANVVTGADGDASAVLLRAGRIVDGIDIARARRGIDRDRELARGPANLCRALGITGELGGTDLDSGTVRVLRAARTPETRSGPRVGVSQAADRPWRFWIADDPTVSAYKRSPRAGVPPDGGESARPTTNRPSRRRT